MKKKKTLSLDKIVVQKLTESQLTKVLGGDDAVGTKPLTPLNGGGGKAK